MKPEQPENVIVYDTTLRDGTQREGISLSCDDKLRIAEKLDELGIDFIEGGWPGSNPKDVAFFERASRRDWRHAELAAFGSTRRADRAAEVDPNMRALLESGVRVCTIFGKSSVMHVREVLRTTLDENLRMIEDSVRYLRDNGRRVIYDAEHFFDGYALDPSYALRTLRAAANGGAECLVLCDTNGGALPWAIESVVREVSRITDTPLGVHAHDDGGLAVANSLAGVRGGCVQVQGTINGYGERCGNANLCAVLPNLALKLGRGGLDDTQLQGLCEVAREVADVANIAPDDHMAYVGRSAFAHKGGVHVSAMRRRPDSYQHIDPQRVGNHMRVVVSELSGRSNLRCAAESLGVALEDDVQGAVLAQLKHDEAQGYAFETAEASVAMILKRREKGYRALFRVVRYAVHVTSGEDSDTKANAVVVVAIGENHLTREASACGPIEALDLALRMALEPSYPVLSDLELSDYKVRILDAQNGTKAVTRVVLKMSRGEQTWSTVGASSNIIAASCRALVDSIEHGLGLSEPTQTSAATAGTFSESTPEQQRAS